MKEYLKNITNVMFVLLALVCQISILYCGPEEAQPATSPGLSSLRPAQSDVVKQVNEVLKMFPLEGLQVQIVDKPYRDPKSAYTYPQGIVVSGDLSFKKAPLNVLEKIVPGLNMVTVHGLVTKPISNMELEASISKSAVKMGDATLTDLSIHLLPSTGSFGLGCTFLLPAPKGAKMKSKAGNESASNALAFKGSIDIAGGADVVFKGSLDGDLEVNGFILQAVGLEAQLNLAALGFPTGLGLRASMAIGKSAIKFAGKAAAGATTSSMMFAGSLECAEGATTHCGIYYSDIINVATKMMKIKLPDAITKKVPQFGIDTLAMQIVPVPTTIAGVSYDQGTSMEMTMVLFGATARAQASLSLNGMEGVGSISRISIPNGKAMIIIADKKGGNTGPSISMKMNKNNVDFSMSGYAEIIPLQMEAQTNMRLEGDRFVFDIAGKLLHEIDCKVNGDFSLSHPENDRLAGELSQNAIDKIADILKKGSAQMQKQAKKDLSGAQREADSKINREIEATKKKIEDQKRSLDRDKKKCKKADLSACGRVSKEGAKIGALETELNVALKGGKGLSHGVLGASEATAYGLGEAGKGLGEASKDFVDIKHIKFDASMKDLKAGKSPIFSISGKVFGQNINLNNVSVDFSHPDKLMKSIVDEIMKKIK